VVGIAEGLEIDVDRMRENLERGGGRIMTEAVLFALAEKIGRAEAQRLVQDLVQRADEERRPLKDLLLADLRVKAQLTSTEIEKLFIPLTYQGAAQLFIDRLATATQARTTRRPETRPPEATRIPAAPQLSSTAEAAKPSAPPPQAEPVPDAARMPATGENAEAPPAETKPEAPQPPMQEATSPAAASASAPPAGEQTAKPQPAAASPRPAEDDAPGALMDVLTRVEAEARAAAAAIAEEQRKRS
jgi:3-carboxy-cis,cis-muconate cycloisomerase